MLSPTGKAAGKLKRDVLTRLPENINEDKNELPEMMDIKTH